jgi:hypothetical protein
MVADCKELMLKLLFVHIEGLLLEDSEKHSNLIFGTIWTKNIIGYENVQKLLEAMSEFVWIRKLCEG